MWHFDKFIRKGLLAMVIVVRDEREGRGIGTFSWTLSPALASQLENLEKFIKEKGRDAGLPEERLENVVGSIRETINSSILSTLFQIAASLNMGSQSLEFLNSLLLALSTNAERQLESISSSE